LAANGARHKLGSGLFLGYTVDAEQDGHPSADASGDDKDDDGVTFTSILRQGRLATVRVHASQAGRLDAFLDFNADGNFAGSGEKILDNVPWSRGTTISASRSRPPQHRP